MTNIVPMKTLEAKIRAKSKAQRLMKKIKSDPAYISIPETSGTVSPLEQMIAEALYEFETMDLKKL